MRVSLSTVDAGRPEDLRHVPLPGDRPSGPNGRRRVCDRPTAARRSLSNWKILPSAGTVRPMRRRCPPLIVVLAMLVLSGCGRRSSTGPLTEVRLGFFPNVSHAQAVLGSARGDFARAVGPVKFSTRQFNAGPSLIEALFADQIDVGYVGPGPVITAYARSHGQGIRVLSGAAADGVVIVARPGSGIRSMADLKGRSIATPQHGNTQGRGRPALRDGRPRPGGRQRRAADPQRRRRRRHGPRAGGRRLGARAVGGAAGPLGRGGRSSARRRTCGPTTRSP